MLFIHGNVILITYQKENHIYWKIYYDAIAKWINERKKNEANIK